MTGKWQRGPSLCWICLVLIVIPWPAQSQQSVIEVGMVIDGLWDRNDEIMALTTAEILTLTEGEFDVHFPEEKTLVADWTLEGINRALDQLLADDEVDLILAMGVLASGEAILRTDLPKPIIAPFVIDAEIQGLVPTAGTSGIPNLNYLSIPSHMLSDIKMFREIVAFDKITILINAAVHTKIEIILSRVENLLQVQGIEPEIVLVERTVTSALNALTPATEAVYVAPLLHLSRDDFSRLVDHLIDLKIPSFSLLGPHRVRQGLLATLHQDIFPQVTRRIALNIQRILLGEKPESLPVAFAVGERLIINMETARQIGVSPPFTVMTEAELINEQRALIERSENLASVIDESIARNLDLLAREMTVEAGAQNVKIARSALLPQTRAAALGLIIDADRADASFGSQPQRSWQGTLTVSQLLYSDKALANLSIQKDLQETRLHELERLRLDIAWDAATTYFNILRSKTFEKIQKENLKRTRSNLELARVRETIGHTGRSEVFRWESEIANARKSVIDAIAHRNIAEIALNRLVHRPAEEPFVTQEADVNDPAIGVSQEGLIDYFDDPISFKTFRAFMAKESIDQSPELQILDAALSAKRREFVSASRSFYLPTIAVQGELSKRFDEGGAGTSSLQLPPEFPLTFSAADQTNWSIGLNFSIPLFEGGGRFAERARAGAEWDELQITRNAVAEGIEQRVRSALHLAGASRAGIQLSREAAAAAKQNHDLVIDAYSRGVLDILDLLDAQNASLNADLAAANATYDFLIDIIEVERSIGGFYYLASPEEKNAWFGRLLKFFEDAGVSPQGR